MQSFAKDNSLNALFEFITSGDIWYLRLIMVKSAVISFEDALTRYSIFFEGWRNILNSGRVCLISFLEGQAEFQPKYCLDYMHSRICYISKHLVILDFFWESGI